MKDAHEIHPCFLSILYEYIRYSPTGLSVTNNKYLHLIFSLCHLPSKENKSLPLAQLGGTP